MANKSFAMDSAELQECIQVLKNIEAAAEVACSNFTKSLTAIIGTDEYLADCVTKDTIIEGAQPMIEAINKLQEDMAKIASFCDAAGQQWQIQVSSVVKKTTDISADLTAISKKVKERKGN